MSQTGFQIVPCKGTIFRGKDMPGYARRHSDLSCAKMAEPIEMPFGLWTSLSPYVYMVPWVHLTQVDPRNHVYIG